MPTDILFKSNGDLDMSGGDMHYGESTYQHQRDILVSRPGDYKSAPNASVGIGNYLNGTEDDLADMLSLCRMKLAKDGMTVLSVRYDAKTESVTVNAPYK